MKESIKIVILEDELLTSDDLKNILEELDHSVEIVSQLQSVSEAFEFFSLPQNFDLIFSDIKLGDGLSFEIFEAFQFDQPVIFCTAYNDYALEAFKSNGIDYLLKPFDKETVNIALMKYKKSFRNRVSAFQQLPALLRDLDIKNEAGAKRILVEKGRRRIPMLVDNFAAVYIEDRIIFAVTFDHKKHVLSGSLESIHSKFGNQFFRANRKYLLHRKAVVDAVHTTDRKLRLNLKIKLSEDVMIGKMKVSEFLDWLIK